MVFDVISELDDTGSRRIIYGGTNSLKVCTHEFELPKTLGNKLVKIHVK